MLPRPLDIAPRHANRPTVMAWLAPGLIAWLVLCMGLQGLVSSAQQAIGRAHHHHTASAQAPTFGQLEVRLAGQHSHGARQAPAPQPHHHRHIAQHAHDTTDATVVAVADPTPGGHPANATLPWRTAQDLWGILTTPQAPRPSNRSTPWPRLAAPRVASAHVMPLDRPPST